MGVSLCGKKRLKYYVLVVLRMEGSIMCAKKIVAIGSLVALSCVLAFPAVARSQKLICSPQKTIGESLKNLKPGDTLLVEGVCNENVFILQEVERITLDGQGLATINGPDATEPTVVVLGRGINIQGFTITGGNQGISVPRGGDATINGNTIQFTRDIAILVTRNSLARVTNNTIQDNPGGGILVTENSSARIGFATGDDTTASPNLIQNNGGNGISVLRSSNARIVGNTIKENRGHGVSIQQGSHAQVSDNVIEGNANHGINVSQTSGVNLGRDTGSGIFDLPNTTTVLNGGFGIRCSLGGYADGRLGSLTGTSGPSGFDGTCINSLLP